MNPTAISYKSVAGSIRSATVSIGGGLSVVEVDAEVAAAVPQMIASLLSGDDASPSDLARLCGQRFDAGWRLEMDIGGQRCRLSRAFALRTLRLEIYEQDERTWRTAARGSAVRAQLEQLVEVPTREMLETIVCATQLLPVVHDDGPAGEEDHGSSRIELVSAGDMFAAHHGEGDADAASELELDLSGPSLELAEGGFDSSDAGDLHQQYRAARTREAIEDQIRGLEDKRSDCARQMASLLDGGDEIQAIDDKLAAIPKLRELTNDEMEVLSRGAAHEEDQRRRIKELEAQVSAAGGAQSARWFLNPAMLAGLVLAVVATSVSVLGGRLARQFALGNLVFLGLALFGALQEIRRAETASKGRRRGDAIGRRLDQLRTALETDRAVRNRLRGEFQVETADQFEQVRDRRTRLEARRTELHDGNRAVLESSDYKKAAQTRARIDDELEARHRALARIEDHGVASWELAEKLRTSSCDTEVVLWHPGAPIEQLRGQLRRIASLAADYGAFSGDQMSDAAAMAWRKLASHVTGLDLEHLSLSLEGVVSTVDVVDGLDVWTDAQAWAIVETLRVSLWRNLLRSKISGVPPFLVRVHPLRIPDAAIADSLRGLYESIAERATVVLVQTATS